MMQIALTNEQIDELRQVPIFDGVDPDQFRWIVRRVEFEHRIGDLIGLDELGIVRLLDKPSG